MYLKAHSTPASAPGDHVWEDESSVVEVPDELGHQLARMPWVFSEVLPGDPDHPGLEEPEQQGGPEKKRCSHEGCKNNAKADQDYCHWHLPKHEIQE
jgi:hypothetical protein